MEGQLSGRQLSARQGAMPLQNGAGRERQGWCQLGMLMLLSQPRCHVPKSWQGCP